MQQTIRLIPALRVLPLCKDRSLGLELCMHNAEHQFGFKTCRMRMIENRCPRHKIL